MLLAFYAFAKYILGQSEKTSEADRQERKDMAVAFNRVAVATETSAREAKQRNGHLGEQNLQIAQLVTSQNIDVKNISESNTQIAKILSKSALIAAEDRDILVSKEQHIETQIVDQQVIKAKI